MPRKARIDAPGALQHIICRGIERTMIFCDDGDRDRFVKRLGRVISESQTPCYAWALIANHFHLLLKTGNVPITTLMRKLLTGHAVTFNRRHQRVGHLFQNRYKSILCQEYSKLKIHVKGDERILGDSDFVESVLEEQNERLARRFQLQAQGVDFAKALDSVATAFNLKPVQVLSSVKQPLRVKARSVLCYWAVKKLEMSGADVARKLNISNSAVSRSLERGEKIATEMKLKLIEN